MWGARAAISMIGGHIYLSVDNLRAISTCLATTNEESSMPKLTLRLEDLSVETFATAGPERDGRGTVFARETDVGTCVTCVPFVCWVSRLETNCCTRDPAGGCSLPQVC